MSVLVLNSGSSSIKYQLFDLQRGTVQASGMVEQIGETKARFTHKTPQSAGDETLVVGDHRVGFNLIVDRLQADVKLTAGAEFEAIGHRVVHGGRFANPALIDTQVIEEIRAMLPLAPLHNGPNLTGIEIARELFPAVPQVAVFDTAFHQTLPAHASTYALPRDLCQRHHIRRFGFHGTSHQYVAATAAAHLGRPLESLKMITLHLGNGASAAAVRFGASVDTSMGLTPLEGLVMGTRCGSIDPDIPLYLMRVTGMSAEEVDTLLNKQSGLKALCGFNDMREIELRAAALHADAQLALDVFCYRIKTTIGAYLAALGGADALVFTAGIGEHSAQVRAKSCAGLEALGIVIDPAKNAAAHGLQAIHANDSRMQVLVVPTDEERQIARLSLDCVKQRKDATKSSSTPRN